MLLGVIADDFTGASDIANTLAKGGLATVQFLGLPTKPAPETCEAGVVALKSRSIAAADAVALSIEAFEWLRAQGCRQFVFKYCSTFDSTPEGNIGPVGEALARALGVGGVAACPAFPTAGRTVYQGHLFVGDRLLNESGLENHPLNPMTDPDLRRWLARQSQAAGRACAVGRGEPRRDGAPPGARRRRRSAANGSSSSTRSRTTTCWRSAMPAPRRRSSPAAPASRSGCRATSSARASRPARAAPSRASTAPRRSSPAPARRRRCAQIEVHRAGHPVLQVEVEAVMEGAVTPEALAAFVHAHRARRRSSIPRPRPTRSACSRPRMGARRSRAALDALFAETAARLVYDGVRRLVVAGGETSGAVVSALSLDALAIGPEIDPGVPALAAADGRPLALALKSGNFGAPDFFAKALNALSSSS